MGILRIVRMEFHEETMDAFDAMFVQVRSEIQSMDGCRGVMMLTGSENPTIRTTLSLWETEAHLQAYRKSELFGAVWPKTKALFSAQPVAWSLEWSGDWSAFQPNEL